MFRTVKNFFSDRFLPFLRRNTTLWRYNLVICAGFSIVLVVVNWSLARDNHASQVHLADNQKYLNETATIRRIYDALLHDMGDAAAKGDTRFVSILGEAGITVTVNPAPAAPAQAPAETTRSRRR